MGDPMPVFVLKGKDALAPGTVDYYRRDCRRHGLTEQAEQVRLAFEEMARWQRRNPEQVRLPDHAHVPAAASTSPLLAAAKLLEDDERFVTWYRLNCDRLNDIDDDMTYAATVRHYLSDVAVGLEHVAPEDRARDGLVEAQADPPSRWLINCSVDAIPPDQTYATQDAASDVIRLHSGGCPGEHAVLPRPAFGERGDREGRDSRGSS